jgi:hypothetical protein
MPSVADFETALDREIGAFLYDPLGYVMFAFPGASRTRRSPARAGPRNGNGTS